MEIKGEDYCVTYDSSSVTIICKGIFRLHGPVGYADIMQLLNDVAEQKPETITLELKELRFLNSSGIDMISKFVLKMDKLKSSKLILRGTNKIPWQHKTLTSLRRLMPDLEVEIL